jgi:hypothetical protein
MHGSKPSQQLLTEYPLADFLLQLLNLAEVEDVILKYVHISFIRLIQFHYLLMQIEFLRTKKRSIYDNDFDKRNRDAL